MATRRATAQRRLDKREWRVEHQARKRRREDYQPQAPVHQEFRTREYAKCETTMAIAMAMWTKPDGIRALLELRRDQLPLRYDVPQRPKSGTLVFIDVRTAQERLLLNTDRLVDKWLGQDGYKWAGNNTQRMHGKAGQTQMKVKYRKTDKGETAMHKKHGYPRIHRRQSVQS